LIHLARPCNRRWREAEYKSGANNNYYKRYSIRYSSRRSTSVDHGSKSIGSSIRCDSYH